MQFANLIEFANWIEDRGAEALSSQGQFRPSIDACQWCPLAVPGLCDARDEWILGDLMGLEDLDDLGGLPAPLELTPERRARLIEHTSTITSWLSQIYAASMQAALDGEPDPGTKLVLGAEGDRKWGDDAAAEALLRDALADDAYERKLKSVAQAEKLLKPGRKKPGNPLAWSALTALVTRAPARPVLVSSNDKRPEYRPAEQMVADLDDLD